MISLKRCKVPVTKYLELIALGGVKFIILFFICLRYFRVKGFVGSRRKMPGRWRRVRKAERRGRSLRKNGLWLDGAGAQGPQMLLEGCVAGNTGSGPTVDAADGGRIKLLHHLRATDNVGAAEWD